MTALQLIGCDGSTWDLATGADGATLSGGMSGLHLPKSTLLWQKTARGSGQTWKGSRMESRTFTMNVLVGDATPPIRAGVDWKALDAQFWAALSTDLTAQLVVDGTRTLTFRLDEGNDGLSLTSDPSAVGAGLYAIDCVADRPEWAGPTVTTRFDFTPTTSDNFFGSTGGLGPPFYISASNLFDTALVANPGDLPAYPVWTITGPVTTATVGVLGATVSLPFPLQSRDVVIIDTESEQITDDQGNNLWPQMGYADVDFSAIPAGDQVPVVLGMDGAGTGASVQVSLTPLYRRAW